MRKYFNFFVTFLLSCFIACLAAPANLSFLVADLKYNENDGIKYCEIQQGSLSAFTGDIYLNKGNEIILYEFANFLEMFPVSKWFKYQDISEKLFRKKLENLSWKPVYQLSALKSDFEFQNCSKLPVLDPSKLSDYHGFLYMRNSHLINLNKFHQEYPGIIIIDEVTFPFWIDKFKMSLVFNQNEELKKYKPRWGLFPKKYDEKLVAMINEEIGSDYYVIKPLSAFCGDGVIIVEKSNLNDTLFYILKKSSSLFKDSDKSYQHWYTDSSQSFIVEEFIPSMTINVPHLGNKPYDPTMRVAFIAYRDEDVVKIYICGGYWKLPPKSLLDRVSLNQKHKNLGVIPNYERVDNELWDRLQEPLVESLTMFYEELLKN